MNTRQIAKVCTLLLLCPAGVASAQAPETTQIAASDGVMITVDRYMHHKAPTTPVIVLFHQAGWSRGEYREIAPRLSELGYNCIAVDQRSGNAVNGVSNETHRRAKKKRKGTTYVDALTDVRSVLGHVRVQYPKAKIVAWGSSYSAALVLRIAGEEPALVDAVVAFAPGEYFRKLGKSSTWIRDAAKKITAPVFITSARKEHAKWRAIFDAVPGQRKTAFVPKTRGNHGSRALWKKFSDSPQYWSAVRAFLAAHVPSPSGN